jgi:hypothetical protein
LTGWQSVDVIVSLIWGSFNTYRIRETPLSAGWQSVNVLVSLIQVLSTTACDTGRLGAGANRRRDGECTWEECGLNGDGLPSVNNTGSEQCSVMIYKLVWA